MSRQTPPPLNRNRLKEVLELHDMTQRELSLALDTGETQVSRWVNGLTPHPQTRKRVCRILGVEQRVLWPHLDGRN